MLVLVYEDIEKDPLAFVQCVYKFIGVSDAFVPSMLHSQINTARTPKGVFVERAMHHTAEFLRRVGLDRAVWFIRTLGIPDIVRSLNTKIEPKEKKPAYNRDELASLFLDDASMLSEYCGRDMVKEWNLV